MNAPDNAYASTLTLKGADGSTLNIRLPKPLKDYVGSETDPTRQLEAFKRLFKTDHAEFVQTKLSDGTLVAGLLAYVREGSVNATFHNIAKTTSASQPSRRGRHTAGIGNGSTVVPYVGLNDGGLNTLGEIVSTKIRYAFGNYFNISVVLKAAYYIDTTAFVKMKESMLATDYKYSGFGEASARSEKTISLINRGGVVIFEKAGTIWLESDVENSEGMLPFYNSLTMLAPLFFGPFVPVNSYADTPQENNPDVCTFLISDELEDVIYEQIKDKQEPSLPEMITSGDADTAVLLLGEGNLSGEVSDEVIEDYYNYVTKGTGSFNAPTDGFWVNTTGRTINFKTIYYGVEIINGHVRSIYRSKAPVTVLPTITLLIDVASVQGSDNEYIVTFSVAVSVKPSVVTKINISSLQVRQTPTGPSVQGVFTDENGSLFSGRTISINTSGISNIPAPAYLTTGQTGDFWVTATATCDNGNYQFINKGGQLGSGSGGITPGN